MPLGFVAAAVVQKVVSTVRPWLRFLFLGIKTGFPETFLRLVHYRGGATRERRRKRPWVVHPRSDSS